MESDDIDVMLDVPFQVPDLVNMWPDILSKYKELGFQIPLTDKEKGGPITDNEMISEFQWIYGQYRKYIGTKKGEVLGYRGNLNDMVSFIENNMIGKSYETPDDRAKLIYQAMRNQWIMDLWSYITNIRESLSEDEENNGWL